MASKKSWKRHPTTSWSSWLAGWDRALEDAGYTEQWGDHPLPIYDVCEDGDFGTLAIEKCQNDFYEKGASPEEAVAECEDRDAFAVKYYDPYIDEFKAELGIYDEDEEDLDETDEDLDMSAEDIEAYETSRNVPPPKSFVALKDKPGSVGANPVDPRKKRR